jgi:hypothetical protein
MTKPYDPEQHAAEWKRQVQDGDDVFFPDQSKYSPSDFVIPAQDHQGHSERLFCRAMPLIERQCDVVVRSRKFPFKTKGDLIRWAIVRALKHLDRLEPMPGLLGRIDALNAVMKDEVYFHEFNAFFDNLQKVINQHIGAKAETEAIRLVAIVKADLMKVEEPHWRDKALGELKQRFGYLLDSGEKSRTGTGMLRGGE